MTYIGYMNQFWRLAESESFAASEVALYAFLVNECNKYHWQMPFSCSTDSICYRLRISKQTLITARSRLAKQKLISYTNGTSRFHPSTYSLLDLTDNLTEDLTGNNKDIDKDLLDKNTHGEQLLLSIEKIEELLSSDTEWQRKVEEYLRDKNVNTASADITSFLASFFKYLRACDVRHKTEEDAKQHFINWICKQGNMKQSNPIAKRGLQTGLILTDDSLEKYKTIEL